MWHCRMNATDPTPDWLDRATDILRAGGVLAMPTDTLYGLAADARNPSAVARVYRIKGRSFDQALPMIASSLGQVEAAGLLPELALKLARVFWPGPLTVVIPAWPGIAPEALAHQHTVAVRVPNHGIARALAQGVGYPITATSANRSGMPPTADADMVAAALGPELDGLIDAGKTPGGPPSTLVDCTGPMPRLLREGAVPWDRVLESVE